MREFFIAGCARSGTTRLDLGANLVAQRSLWREQSRFRILSRCEISTSHELVNLLPRLAEEGVLVVDDYGA